MPCSPIKQSGLWAPPVPLTPSGIRLSSSLPTGAPSWAPALQHLFHLLTVIMCARRAQGCVKGASVPHSVEPLECFLSTLPSALLHITLTWFLNVILYEYWCLDSFSFVSGNCFTCQFGMTDASKYSKACEPVMVIPFSQHLCRWTQNTALYSTSSASTYLERGLCAGYRPLIGVKIWSTDIQPVPFVFTVKIGADVFLQEFGVKPGAGIFPTQ